LFRGLRRGSRTGGQRTLAVSANDNKAVLDNGVTKVLLDPAPDTVAVIDMRGPSPRLVAEIEAPATVVGSPVSAVVAPDESIALVTSGKRAFNDQMMSDNVLSVIDLKATPPRVIQTVYVGAGADGVSNNRKGTLALVANRDEGPVSTLRITGNAVEPLSKVKVGDEKSGPSHVIFTPDGARAFVTRDNDGRISVLSVKGEVVEYTKRDLYAGQRPYPIDICKPGDIAVVGNVGLGNGDEDTISLIDVRADPPRVIETLAVGQTPEGAVCSPDGRYVAVTAMSGSNKASTSPFYAATAASWCFVSWASAWSSMAKPMSATGRRAPSFRRMARYCSCKTWCKRTSRCWRWMNVACATPASASS
jgi:DNA-binding beta-propeller fold protein YncE